MTIEHKGREVGPFGRTLVASGLLALAKGREGAFVLIEPFEPEQVVVFEFGKRGTNGPREEILDQAAGFFGAQPKDHTRDRLPRGYAVQGEQINMDPICRQRGITWRP